ncbi:uncharacterized protein LOC144362659, partial [Saccoglossus kowalevskii]
MPTRWPSTSEIQLFTERFIQSKPADKKTVQPQFSAEVASTSTYTQCNISIVLIDTATYVETELDLSYGKHKSIDLSRLGLYKHLRILNLSGNGLTIVPQEIGECHELQKLNLSFNKFAKIPDSLCALEQLTELYMESNALTAIPDEISKLKNLKILNLNNNNIAKIPDSLGALEQLTDLNMGFNALTTIPSGIKNLKLRLLRLNYNKLKEFPWQIIEEL